jgi:DNA-binding response OmpR family regulator
VTRVLLVEDESRVASFVARGLEAAGYRADVVGSGAEAVDRVGGGNYDVVLLDVGLPDKDGFHVLAEIRTFDTETRIIMLTARGDVPSRVRGLDLGADDYLPKPFDFDELLARIRAQLRTSRQPAADVIACEDLSLDLKARRVTRDDRVIDLTTREFALLEFFMRHPGQVLSRSQLQSGVWGYGFDPGSNVVDVYVGYLRSKLDREGAPSVIETVRGGGYRLTGGRPSEALDTNPPRP